MRAAALFLVAFAWTATARAAPTPKPTPTPAPTAAAAPKPWATGVTDDEQSHALEIYKQANTEFEEGRYAQALAKYRDAIKHWDHPAIRFNMVVCLVNLDQPLEAFDDLESALKYGDAPLGADVYAQALTYKKLLLGQLARVEITSTERDAEATFDGTKLFTAPGTVTKLVLPGDHQIVATKSGFLTTTLPMVLIGGKSTVTNVTLTRLTSTNIVRRWAPWKPWLAVGAGAAVAITGGVLERYSYEHYRTFSDDAAFTTPFSQGGCASGCGGPGQPPLPPGLVSERHRARIDNDLAVSMFAVGGAALVGGAIAVYLDQPTTSTFEKNLMLTPVFGAGATSLVLGGTF